MALCMLINNHDYWIVQLTTRFLMRIVSISGIRRTHALRDQRRQNLNQHINNHQAAASNLQPPGNNNNNSAVSQPQQQSQQQSQQRTSETSLAIALMGIVVMHIVCQILRVFLAGLAVYFIHDTLFCLQKQVGFAPPLWTMCAESVSSLLIMINFSGKDNPVLVGFNGFISSAQKLKTLKANKAKSFPFNFM